ncbi:MAG: hypothetical protein ACKVOO_00550 [Burkholderiaceae bacterium]
MLIKPADVKRERALILARDARRKYGVRVEFQVQHLAHFGDMENVSILLPDGAIASVAPTRMLSWEGGEKLRVTLEGYATAAQAEQMGVMASQALLMTALSFNFGLRLHYRTREPGAVFDRLASPGCNMWGEMTSAPRAQDVLSSFTDTISDPLLDRRVRLSMEIFSAALLEPNDRVRFIMLVSAIEPLAEQHDLGHAVAEFVDSSLANLALLPGIDSELKQSLQSRVAQLKRESVGRALSRLSETWFPGNLVAKRALGHAYALRSQLLHDGAPHDPDIQFWVEADRIAPYIRLIYQRVSRRAFRSQPSI